MSYISTLVWVSHPFKKNVTVHCTCARLPLLTLFLIMLDSQRNHTYLQVLPQERRKLMAETCACMHNLCSTSLAPLDHVKKIICPQANAI